MDKSKNIFYRLRPFLLSLTIIVADQLSKAWVIKNIPLNTVYKSFGKDLLMIIHVRNTGAAFSLGASGSAFTRLLFFIILPLAVMGFIAWVIYSEKGILNRCQKYLASGILGGGIGTLIDRIFRFKDGVVDFISVKFFGILGMERWPTFNVSDSCVVIFVILFALSVLFEKGDKK